MKIRLGEYIRINGEIYFKVIETTVPTSSGNEARKRRTTLVLPFTTFQNATMA